MSKDAGKARFACRWDPWSMRQVYAHDALVRMRSAEGADAVGAAITVALCGDWQHEPPCPLAPHHTQTERTADEAQVRTIFATQPSLESEVRQRIDQALAQGTQVMPTGEIASWQLLSSEAGVVQEGERDHGDRLISS
jgi:hypothetical protein